MIYIKIPTIKLTIGIFGCKKKYLNNIWHEFQERLYINSLKSPCKGKLDNTPLSNATKRLTIVLMLYKWWHINVSNRFERLSISATYKVFLHTMIILHYIIISHLPLKDILLSSTTSFPPPKQKNISYDLEEETNKKKKKLSINIHFINFPFKSGAPLTSSKRGDFDARTRHEAK